MRRVLFVLIQLVGALGAAALVAPSSTWAQGSPPPTPVEVAPVSRLTLTPTTQLLGTIEPRRRSVVAASIEGYVIDYPLREGQKVEAGQTLAKLRDSTLRLQLAQAKAALEEIRARHGLAVKELERVRSLIEKDAKTEKELDAAALQEKTLSLQIPQAQAQVEILEADLAKKTVTAPFDGQITEERSQVGEWLARGGAVAVLVDVGAVRIRVAVPERYIRHVTEGSALPVLVASARDGSYEARVVSVSFQGDAESRTFPVLLEIANDGSLRAGMTASVEVPTGAPGTALVVSKDAVLLEGGAASVYVVTGEGTAERRGIVMGRASGSSFEVLDGLSEGERVVVRGNERLQPGARVRVVERPTGAPRE